MVDVAESIGSHTLGMPAGRTHGPMRQPRRAGPPSRAAASRQQKAGGDQEQGTPSLRMSIASAALAAAFVLTPVATGHAPALCQDFSITNQAEPANPGHRDLMRQLQAWWDAHAYYPRHASNSNEAGTVKVHLEILPDGRIWTVNVVGSSGSHSIDAAGEAVFLSGFVQPFPQGEPKADIDIWLHFVLTYRHDQPAAAGPTPVSSKSPFTITNEPARSPILDTMIQRTCTGTMVLGGIANHPAYGIYYAVEAVFFRKPDGTPWVKMNERGFPSLSSVTQIGQMVTWTGRQEWLGGGKLRWLQYTLWPDGENHLKGSIGERMFSRFGVAYNPTGGGSSIDLTCAAEILPTITWNDWLVHGTVTSPFDLTPVDPP
jgi:TonB family protein